MKCKEEVVAYVELRSPIDLLYLSLIHYEIILIIKITYKQ